MYALTRRTGVAYVIASFLFLLLTAANLFQGSTDIAVGDIWASLVHPGESAVDFIVWQTRVPALLTALFAGAALAVSGLVMQTVFANPLADPGILGVNAGAALGAAIAMLFLGGTLVAGEWMISGFLLVSLSALLGAAAVIAVLLLCSAWMRQHVTLLIIGIMISYIAGALIALLNFFSTDQGVHSFVFWGFGDFSNITLERIPMLAVAVTAGCVALLLAAKPLNALLLGTEYASNLGFSIRRTRTLLLFIAGGLSAIVTAVCGPISFLGLAVPHAVRLIARTADHRHLLTLCIIAGADLALFCNWICHLPGDGQILPLNAITPIIGVPIVLYLLLKGKNNF